MNREELDRLLGLFFFGCNIPFVVVESALFRNFIRALNPNYVLPSKKTLSNSNLNNRYNELQHSIANMRVNDAVLLIDGWKNKPANKQNVVAMLRLDNMERRKYIFLNTWNFSTYRETGEALRQVVDECVGMAREKYNINIIAVITDNASNMILMGNLVAIWHSTCNSHSGNLLAKSAVDEEFARKVNGLLKNFKHPDLEARIIQNQGNRMVLIGATRWCSHRDAFRRCLANLQIMREIADTDHGRRLISEENRDFLQDLNLENQLLYHTLILDPICELTNTCQRADCTIAGATELWLRLEIPVVDDNIAQMIDARRGRAVNAYGLAANFLHPQYRGRRFSDNQELVDQVNVFFRNNLPAEGLLELEDYRHENGLFRYLFERNYRSPFVFWKAAELHYPRLSNLALKLNLLCASTGQLERLFSEWAYVHSWRRNRLSDTRSAKLVAIYYDLRLSDQLLINLYNEDEDEDDND